MARGVQITIVTSLRARCRFVEFLKDIMLNIFIENKRYAFAPALLLKNNTCVYFLKSFIRFSVVYES